MKKKKEDPRPRPGGLVTGQGPQHPVQSARKKPRERSDQKFASLGYLLDFAVILLPSSWNISLPPEPGALPAGPAAVDPRRQTAFPPPACDEPAREDLPAGWTAWVRARGSSVVAQALAGPRGGAPAGGAGQGALVTPRPDSWSRSPDARTLAEEPASSELPLGASSPPAAPAPPSSLPLYWPFSPRCRDQKPRMGHPRGGMLREGLEGALSSGHRLSARKKGHETT